MSGLHVVESIVVAIAAFLLGGAVRAEWDPLWQALSLLLDI